MKKMGKEKRDILVSRILDAKKAQPDAAAQFQNALEAFESVTNFSGGDLEEAYNKLSNELKEAQERASKVSDGKLKNDSRQLLRGSEQRQAEMLRQMRVSEAKMKPVLQKLFDQVTDLKCNLSARAISSLKTNAASIDTDVPDLIREFERSNQEADKAIAGLEEDSEP